MKYIQTLFISKNQNLFKDSFGWVSPLYHLLSWGLSALTLKKALGNLTLYTNSYGKEILVDLLKLPYDNVVLSFDGWELPHKELWALSKIYTYSLQTTPFIHIDGDIYLFNPFPNEFKEASLIAQNIEQFTDYYYSVMKPINRKFTYMPEYVKNDFLKQESLHAVNAGILGGNDLSFFKDYTQEATRYVESNLDSLHTLDANRFNVFFEQHLFFNMARTHKLEIKYLLSQEYHDNAYLGLDKFYDIPSGKSWYFHLLGNYKRDIFTCQQMANTLHALYPDVYERIITEYNRFNATSYDFDKMKCSCQNFILHTFSEILNSSCLTDDKRESLVKYIDSIEKILPSLCKWSVQDINKRDEACFYWYHRIFESEIGYETVLIKKSPMVEVIFSNFDWARLYKGLYSSGIKYYSEFSIEKMREGEKYAAVLVPELIEKVSLSDIDEIEYALLQELDSPISISTLEKRMVKFLDEDVDDAVRDKFRLLLKNSIIRLVLLKVIEPI